MNLFKWPDAKKSPGAVQLLHLNNEDELNSFSSNSILFTELVGLSISNGDMNSIGNGLNSPLNKRPLVINLSEFICKLENLKSIRVYGFLIECLPDCFFAMENLEDVRLEVDFDDFFMSSLNFLKLKKLQNLKLIGHFTEGQNDFLYSIFSKNIKFATY